MALKWEWQDNAACKGAWPPVDMVNLGQGHSAQPLIEGYCNKCQVVRECGEFALADITNSIGIWGGVHLPNRKRTQAIKALRTKCAILSSGDAAA